MIVRVTAMVGFVSVGGAVKLRASHLLLEMQHSSCKWTWCRILPTGYRNYLNDPDDRATVQVKKGCLHRTDLYATPVGLGSSRIALS